MFKALACRHKSIIISYLLRGILKDLFYPIWDKTLDYQTGRKYLRFILEMYTDGANNVNRRK